MNANHAFVSNERSQPETVEYQDRCASRNLWWSGRSQGWSPQCSKWATLWSCKAFLSAIIFVWYKKTEQNTVSKSTGLFPVLIYIVINTFPLTHKWRISGKKDNYLQPTHTVGVRRCVQWSPVTENTPLIPYRVKPYTVHAHVVLFFVSAVFKMTSFCIFFKF